MRKKVIKISKPGISKGNKLFGFKYLGSKLENALSTNKEKYIVMPIGIKTTIPAKK